MKKATSIIFILFCISFFIHPAYLHAQKPAATQKVYDSLPGGEYLEFDGFKTKKSAIIQQIKRKTDLLELYFNKLIEKKEPDPKKIIDLAMGLFNNDENVIVTITSNKSTTPTTKTIRSYLTKISQLPYSKIDVQYSNYQLIGNIEKAPDGTYHGIAVMTQEFTGEYDVEGKPHYQYHDVIERRIEYILKITYVDRGDKDKSYYKTEVFFGNMGVSETKTRQ